MSTDGRFSLEFPENWQSLEKEMWSVPGELAMFLPRGFFNHDPVGCIAGSQRIPRDLFWDIDRINDEMHQENFKDYQDVQIEEEKKIDLKGLEAKNTIYSVSDNGRKVKLMNCITMDNDRIYSIICGVPYPKFSKYKGTFEKIIQSFKVESSGNGLFNY
ncbi:MAG: hypothetical protein KKH25_04470 [Candidatus Omnitrophica bacterium]|nr:hypothetical protein [Candidatus Omnitrophota bacterium]